MKVRKASLQFFLIYLVLGSITLHAQQWDYEKYPKLDVDITHLKADLNLKDNADIEGDIEYSIEFRINGVDSLVFDAIGMNISSVEFNNSSLEYEFDGDKVIISLAETQNRGDSGILRIQYEASPKFGIHVDEYGSVWTSNLPASNRHWLPTIDNPRVSFSTELAFTHPAEYTVVASGKRIDSELVTVDQERTIFQSEKKLPVTALNWSMGDFSQIISTAEGADLEELFDEETAQLFSDPESSQIHVYSTSNNVEREEVLKKAVSVYEKAGRELNQMYPYNDLHIVVLDDYTWETKNYGAGTVYLYNNLENVSQQLERGIIAQWIGVHLRELQWDDADAILLLQSMLAETFSDDVYQKDLKGEPYDIFSYETLERWNYFMNQPENEEFISIVQQVFSDVVGQETGVIDWQAFAQKMYDKTGQPFFDRLSVPELDREEAEEKKKIVYRAEYEWDEEDQTIQIRFNAENEYTDALVTVQAEQITFRDTTFHELTFSGESDGVTINVSSDIENLKLSVEDRDDIILDVRKPFMFWIYQLRNDDSTDRRVEAADALARFEDNPDLQLALDDILRDESDPEVYAAILSSLSSLTRGASGTHERFIEMSSSQQPLIVRLAAVEALAYFPNNDRVINRLRNVALQTDDSDLRMAAIKSLIEVTEEQRFRSLISEIVMRENALYDTPKIIQLLAESGDPEAAIEHGSTFITNDFPYEIRTEILQIMVQHDRNSSNWEERIPDLISDRDPRIRYQAVQGLQNTSSEFRDEIKSDRLHEEFDERVRRALVEL